MVSGFLEVPQTRKGLLRSRALNKKGGWKIDDFQPIIRRISETVQDGAKVSLKSLIYSAFDCYQSQRPGMTLNGRTYRTL